MKKRIIPYLALGLLLSACQPEQNSLIGTWNVDKVNVQFDERKSTPELVKQMGEMERKNTFSISSDSTMIFKGLDTEWQGKVSLVGDSTLRCEGKNFGIWSKGRIVTKSDTPLGEVVVTYKKE